MPNLKNKTREIVEFHNKLAVRFKEYETADGALPSLVVLNEMRYALRAIIKLLDQASFDHLSKKKDKEIFNKSYQEAHHALRCAYHDLVDGLLIKISKIMDDLRVSYPEATIKVLGSKRLDILHDLNQVEEHVQSSRGEGIKRNEIYEEEIYQKWFSKILDHYKYIDQIAIAEVIKEDAKIRNENLVRKIITTVSIAFGIIGIIVGIISIL